MVVFYSYVSLPRVTAHCQWMGFLGTIYGHPPLFYGKIMENRWVPVKILPQTLFLRNFAGKPPDPVSSQLNQSIETVVPNEWCE